MKGTMKIALSHLQMLLTWFNISKSFIQQSALFISTVHAVTKSALTMTTLTSDQESLLPIVSDLEVTYLRPNGPTISFRAAIPSGNDQADAEYFLHPKCTFVHQQNTFSTVIHNEHELIPINNDTEYYIHKLTSLKSNRHYALKFDLYIFADMIEEYEQILNFTSEPMYFTTLDDGYWISANECRTCSLSTFQKMDDNIFRFIASFCVNFNFYGISPHILIEENGTSVTVKEYIYRDKYYNSCLFGEFQYARDERKFHVSFILERIAPSSFAIGFASPAFEFESKYAVFLENYGKVQCHDDSFAVLENPTTTENIFKSGVVIHMEMDLKTKIGSIYLGDEDHPKLLLRVQLPDIVTIVLNFTADNQRVTANKCGYVI